MAVVIAIVIFASNKMVFEERIDCDARARIYYLSHVRLSLHKVADLSGISLSIVFRIAQGGGVNKQSLWPASRKGRLRKLTERQKRLITRGIVTLRTASWSMQELTILKSRWGLYQILKWKSLLLFTSTKERASKERWSENMDIFC